MSGAAKSRQVVSPSVNHDDVEAVVESLVLDAFNTFSSITTAGGEQTKKTKRRQAAVSPARGPYRSTLVLMDEVKRILGEFRGTMSTRQVFYQLVSCGAVPNSVAGYDKVQRLLVQMRRAGSIPYDRIVDRTRSKHQRAGWEGAQEILEACAEQYRRNRWTEQDTIVMIACEKQALEGVFAEVCDDYGASLWVVHGFSSLSFSYEWAQEIQRLTADGHDIVISYFGDHDPSGLNIEHKSKETLRELGAVFEWERRGLLWSDFEEFDLVNVPVKLTDSRSGPYLKKYGNRAAELDALRPDELQNRIRFALEDRIDDASWDRLTLVERAERESISKVAGAWDRVLSAVGGAP